MMGKNIFVSLCLFSATSVITFAQEKRWLFGTGITSCNYIDNPGLNVNVTYRLTGNLHIGPDFSALLNKEISENGKVTKKKELEYNFNAQYLFEIRKKLSLYPLAGINLSRVTFHTEDEMPDKRWITALNLGGGFEYRLEKFRLFVESKYVTQLNKVDVTTGIILEL
ncbi:MAG: outer membrane beta-barrel protein [Chryseolinea sp.]